MRASGLNVIAGLWLMIAPFVLGYGEGDPIWNDVVFGAVTALLAIGRISGAYEAAWLSWINTLVGAWIVASALWLDSTYAAIANDVIVGALVFLFGVASATATSDAKRAGGYGPPL